MKYVYVLPVLLLLCSCGAKPTADADTQTAASTAEIRTVSQTAEKEAELNRILSRAENLETETTGSGLKWCTLAAELLELAPLEGCRVNACVSQEARDRLLGASMLLAGRNGSGLLEDCGHPPLSRVWSPEEIRRLFIDLNAAGDYAKNRSKTA